MPAKSQRFPLSRYPDYSGPIVDALTFNLSDGLAGKPSRWCDASNPERGRAFAIEAGVDPTAMRKDALALWRKWPRVAPFVTNETASDLPTAWGVAIERTIPARLAAAPPTLARIANERHRATFHAGFSTMVVDGGMVELQEGGDIPHRTLSARQELGRLRTYGSLITIPRPMLLNDGDAQILGEVRRTVDKIVSLKGDILFALLSANNFSGTVMSDGEFLFSAAHANVGTGAISAASLAAGYEAMLDKKDMGNNYFLATEPKYLIVGPKLVVTAKTELTKASFDNQLEVIAEPRLGDSVAWYLAADPTRCCGLEWGSLSSMRLPRVQIAPQFQVDGMQYRVIWDLGAWAVDWRPLYRSSGI